MKNPSIIGMRMTENFDIRNYNKKVHIYREISSKVLFHFFLFCDFDNSLNSYDNVLTINLLFCVFSI